MSVTIGAQLGSHELIGLLGKGGMGEVYRARDTKLKREVAIKILPDEFSSFTPRDGIGSDVTSKECTSRPAIQDGTGERSGEENDSHARAGET